MNKPHTKDLGFNYTINKNESVIIQRNGISVTTLRGDKAADFISRVQSLSFEQEQKYMAKLTGNYKRGNEKPGKQKE